LIAMNIANWNSVCVRARPPLTYTQSCLSSALKENTMCVVRRFALTGLILLCFCGNLAFAEDAAPPPDPRTTPEKFDRANNAWMLTSSALVLMMTAPGLALFYCGLVRKKNVLGVMMQCFFLMGILSIVWALWGYSLAFGPNALGGFVGGTDYMFLRGVMATWDASTEASAVPSFDPYGISRSVHMVYQMMFFIITPALICGAYAERMKFSTMVVFTILWGTFVYCPIAHWVWSDQG